MFKVLTCITQEHSVPLVLVAAAICFIACFATLTLTSRAAGARGPAWLFAGAAAFGCGTWAAHFISMLAFNPRLPLGYDFKATLISILVAITGSILGLRIFLKPGRRWQEALAVGLTLGATVGAMHFIGMSGVHVAGRLFYEPSYIVASLPAGAIFFAAAYWAAPGLGDFRWRMIGGSLLALGILALHFTAMAAVTILPDPFTEVPPNLLANQPLALLVAAITLMILIMGIVAAHLDRRVVAQTEKDLLLFRQLADASFSGVFVYRDRVILDVNQALCDFMGCDRSDLIGHDVAEFVPGHELARLAERIRADQVENAEFEVLVKSGRARTVEVVTRVIDYGGVPARVTALRDVTERKRDEFLREVEHDIMISIAENTPLPGILNQVCRAAETALPDAMCSVLLVDKERRVLRTGAGPTLPQSYSALVDGLPVGEGYGSCGTAAARKQRVIVADIASDPLWQPYRAVARDYDLGACWSVPLLTKNGEVVGTFATYHKRPYAPSAADLKAIDRLGASAAIAIERSYLHEELIAAKNSAEAASRAKSGFLANMSHELRTPLNAILGFSEIISQRGLGEAALDKYVEYAGDIHRSGSRLLVLINEILDVARVEAGKVKLDLQPWNLSMLVEEQLRVLRHAYPNAAPVRAELGANCPELRVDYHAFGQVLTNVIGNAAKFTPPEGSIIVACDAGGEGLRLTVTDTGPGIPEDLLSELGKPFQQLESAYSRRHSGTGLGLYISRSLMRLHGGDLQIASTLGEGTIVTLVLPEDCVLRPPVEVAAVLSAASA